MYHMTTQFLFKIQSEVTEFDKGEYLALIDGEAPPNGLLLVHSREVKLEPLARRQTRETVYSLISRGQLDAYKFGRSRRITEQQITQCLNRRNEDVIIVM